MSPAKWLGRSPVRGPADNLVAPAVYVFSSVSALRASKCMYGWAFRRFARRGVCIVERFGASRPVVHVAQHVRDCPLTQKSGHNVTNIGITQIPGFGAPFSQIPNCKIQQFSLIFIVERRCAAELT